MELKRTRGRGRLEAFTLSADGRPVETLVSDPANGTGPVGLRQFTEAAGGSVPILPECWQWQNWRRFGGNGNGDGDGNG